MPCESNALPPSQSNPISALVMEVMDSSPPEKDKKKVKKLAFKAYLDDKKAKNELVFLDGSFSTELEKENVDFEVSSSLSPENFLHFALKFTIIFYRIISVGPPMQISSFSTKFKLFMSRMINFLTNFRTLCFRVQSMFRYINIGCDIITTNTYHHAYETLAPIYGCNATNSAFRVSHFLTYLVSHSCRVSSTSVCQKL